MRNQAKIIVTVVLLLFVIKPFLGFSMFSRLHPPKQENIFVKVFSKRMVEFGENSEFNVAAVQKRLGQPLDGVLLFSAVLSLLIPFVLSPYPAITCGFLRRRRLALQPGASICLLNGNLTI
jgi:hypothetical protein